MTITLRDATPADADLVAWVQVEASRSGTPLGFWDLAFPGADAVLERGRAAGFRAAQITYLIGNAPAQRAYERIGFVEIDRKTDAQFEAIFGAPGTVRMTMAI
jgi:GNAT superfamily N-acetyltransferase